MSAVYSTTIRGPAVDAGASRRVSAILSSFSFNLLASAMYAAAEGPLASLATMGAPASERAHMLTSSGIYTTFGKRLSPR